MEPIPSNPILPAASTARGPAEEGEKAGSPDAAHPGESRFESILKSTEAGQEGSAKGGSFEPGGRRAATAGKETKGDVSALPSVSSAVWSSVVLAAPNDSLRGAGVVASEPEDAGSAKATPVPVPSIAATLPAEGDPRGAEGARKREDDVSAGNEGEAEPAATPPADGNRGVPGRPAPPRPVGTASDPGIIRFEEKAFVITRKSDTSIEVTLAPPGVGKLEIEVVLEKGVVNARIIAADSAGRDAVARSLPHIVEALARDGMNVGGFTVSLKGRRDGTGDAPAHGAPRDPEGRHLSAVPPASSASAASAGLVDIFV